MLAALGGTARAADPNAPRGAPPDWLPSITWVQDHWLPYDEGRLYRLLHTSREGILQWLRIHNDDPRWPLAEFARERGVPVRGLAGRLVGPRPSWVSLQLYRVLVLRAENTLTQAHLAHHMFGHVFHVQSLQHEMPILLGLSWAQIDELHYGYGMSFAQIARRQGLNQASFLRTLLGILKATEERGVRLHETPASEARRWLALQQLLFNDWFTVPVPPNKSYLNTGALTALTSQGPAVSRAGARVARYYCPLLG